MKTLLMAALMTATLAGCASSGWQDYAAKNDCVPTGNVDYKKEAVMSSMSAGAGSSQGYNGGVATVAVPRVTIRKVFQYACKGGPIWTYNAPPAAGAAEMVATQRQ